jgi:hypothetical protein
MLHTMIEEEDDAPPSEELEMAVEELTGKDTPGDALDRIGALRLRIAYLQTQLDSMPEPAGNCAEQDAAFTAIWKVGQDLADAKAQLAQLQANHEGRN